MPTIKRYLKLRRETGDVEPKPVPGPEEACKGTALEEALPGQACQPRPDARSALRAVRGGPRDAGVSAATMSRAFRRLGLPLKKVPLRGRARRRRTGALGRVGRDPGDRLVFVDEWGTHTSMTAEGMGPSLAVIGGTTKEVFEAYVGRVLAPSLSPAQVVVLDNLGAHKGERVEARGCE